MKFLLIIILILICNLLHSQDVDSGFYYYNKRLFKENSNFLTKKIKENNYAKDDDISKASDYYNLACIKALQNKIEDAFFNLNLSLSIDSSSQNFITEPDFYNLLNIKQWQELLIQYKKTKQINYNDSLFLDLSKIAIQDQAFYNEIAYYAKSKNLNPIKTKQLWHIKDSLNKINLNLIESYQLKNINLLSNKMVGDDFASKCFLVIQHSDYKTQEKYLPIINSLFTKKETSGENYALLYDRVSVNKTKGKQYYGTQVNSKTNMPYFIIDEKNVDNRRKTLEMVPLTEYLLDFDIKYVSKKK